ncbi:MAG: FAD-binding protein, partial [Acidimicrobiia bacterium]|nr:FAD-binding protein [Acidimicrobiia bacterium]
MEGHAGVVCFPRSTDEVRRCMEVAVRHRLAVTARGSGTGLAGGAVPLDEAMVVSTSKMDRILSVDVANRRAWVEPGVLNLDLSRAVAVHGLNFAPDPSSQQVCSLGGNVANNSGGPHCLSEGVTSVHVLALEVVLPDATVVMLG